MTEMAGLREEVQSRNIVASAFPQEEEVALPREQPYRTWLGHVASETYSDRYNEARNALSNDAYAGNWDGVIELLDFGSRNFGENWASAPRLKPLSKSDSLSMWTPLHQAAFWRAPEAVVKDLIAKGAFRTLRSRKSEFAYPDQTPVEIAQELGYSELVEHLAPVIRSPIPKDVLVILQSTFHDLIRQDVGTRVDEEKLYLPLLEILTELDDESVWFGVQGHPIKHAGYLFRLDGRDLVVRSCNMIKDYPRKDSRITASGIFEVGDAIMLNDY